MTTAGRGLGILLALTVLLIMCPAEAAARESVRSRQAPPNILILVGDDMGWPDFGFHGNDRIQTPALDALASTGVLFPNGHLWGSVCVPTHRSMLTGVHQLVETQPVEQWPTLPRILGTDRGDGFRYRTFQAGKLWDEGPTAWGFDETHGDAYDPGDPIRRGDPGWGREGWAVESCGSLGDPERPCPALQSWNDFLDSDPWEDGARFFAMLTPEIPHVPTNPPRAYRDLYAGVALEKFQRLYYPMTTWFDELLAEVLASLRKRGLRNDTLIIFLSDNGGNSAEYLDPFYPEENRGKGSLYELGFRTPVILNWPAGQLTGGKILPDLVSLSDVFITIAEVAQVEALLHPLVRGSGLLNRVRGGRRANPRTEIITEFGSSGSRRTHGVVVRTPKWRYVHDIRNDTVELFAIDQDPREENDLAPGADPDDLVAFESLVKEWRDGLARPVERRFRRRRLEARNRSWLRAGR